MVDCLSSPGENPFEAPPPDDDFADVDHRPRGHDLLLLWIVGLLVTPFLIAMVGLAIYVAESAIRLLR